MQHNQVDRHFSKTGRRAFIRNGSLILLGASTGIFGGCNPNGVPQGNNSGSLQPTPSPLPLKFGLVTDLHYADKATAGSRHYRESTAKLQEAIKSFDKPEIKFVVELGDLIDAAESVEEETAYLKTINSILTSLSCDMHYVLGNHCVTTLTKPEFLGEVGQQESFYSFDVGGYHFVILDACFRSDGEAYGRNNFKWTDANIPQSQIDWLRKDLQSTKFSTIVFAHQRLDVCGNHSVKNAASVRQVLEESKKVLAVFQGHSHKNSYQEINEIHYCVLTAMVEGSGADNNGYSVVEIHEGGDLCVAGFRKQSDYDWPA